MSGDFSFEFVEVTGSTNADLAAALKGENHPREGHWLVALRQSAGKGRQGREWFDGAGNFMGSTVVELQPSDPPPPSLAFVAALAVGHAVVSHFESPDLVKLKWPNDVLLDGGKVSGILLELVGKSVVIGIGVNLKVAPKIEGRKTAALGTYVERPSPESFAALLATKMRDLLATWRAEGLKPFLEAFQDGSIHQVGASVTVHDTDGSYIEGTYLGLDPSDGALRLRLADGSERVIRAGDVS